MALLDASALLASLFDEPGADAVRSILKSGQAAISAVNLAEVVDRLARVVGVETDVIDSRLDDVTGSGSLRIVEVTGSIGRRAGLARAAHYHHTRSSVSLADCIAAATAATLGESLVTTDANLANVAREIGVDVMLLTSS